MKRILGLDIARAVAILGMLADHFGPPWLMNWVQGWPSLMFAFLSGISLSLMWKRYPRSSIVIRGLVLTVLGVFLGSLGADMMIILSTLGISFLLAALVIGARPKRLIGGSVAAIIVMPVVSFALRMFVFLPAGDEAGVFPRLDHFTSLEGIHMAVQGVLLDGIYPVATWLPVIGLGVGIGKLGIADMNRGRMALAGLGSAAASAAVALGALACRIKPAMLAMMDPQDIGIDHIGPDNFRLILSGLGTPMAPADLLFNDAHTGTMGDVALCVGISLMLLAGCLWLGDRFGTALYPLIATGSCALTVYVGQVLASAGINRWLPDVTDVGAENLVPFAAYAGTAVVFCSLWKLYFRRGPLEEALHFVSTKGKAR